jgi:hypothetical protein
MSANPLGSELTRLADDGGAAALAGEVLRRDRARIRNLAGVVIGLWLLAALLIPAVLLPMWAKIKENAAEQQHAKLNEQEAREQYAATHAAAAARPHGTRELTGFEAFEGLAMVSTFIATVTTLASLLGAIATVWLVLSVRRSTLRQISVGLAQVSEQLRQLQRSSPA